MHNTNAHNKTLKRVQTYIHILAHVHTHAHTHTNIYNYSSIHASTAHLKFNLLGFCVYKFQNVKKFLLRRLSRRILISFKLADIGLKIIRLADS